MNDSRACTRPRFLLALLLAVLVVEALPAPAAAARRDKTAMASAWRAASIRPAEPAGDPGPGGAPPFAALPPAPLAVPHPADADAGAPRTPHLRPGVPAAGRSALPRAPPTA